jgi:hemerythrin-like domain-containing protein
VRLFFRTPMQPEPTSWKGIHTPEFRRWVRTCAPSSGEPLSPADELLAEHHLAAAVILAMEEGANRLLHGESSPGFWSGVVEFIGDFMHLVHRAKEARCFRAAVESGILAEDESTTIELEHEDAKQTTLELIDAVERGDWEATYRHVAFYAHVMRPHMKHEEQSLIPALRSVDSSIQAGLRAAFDDVEATATNGRNRLYYLDLARRLCTGVGVEHPLGIA